MLLASRNMTAPSFSRSVGRPKWSGHSSVYLRIKLLQPVRKLTHAPKITHVWMAREGKIESRVYLASGLSKDVCMGIHLACSRQTSQTCPSFGKERKLASDCHFHLLGEENYSRTYEHCWKEDSGILPEWIYPLHLKWITCEVEGNDPNFERGATADVSFTVLCDSLYFLGDWLADIF